VGGSEVDVDVDGASIRVEAVAGSELMEEAGLLVIPPTGATIDDAMVRELRLADQR
jgi:hypothetical protein